MTTTATTTTATTTIIMKSQVEYKCLILPRLSDEKFIEVDLAAEADAYNKTQHNIGQNPMESAEYQVAFLSHIQNKYKCKYTIGGYCEDRSELWSGFEQSKSMLHLGVDINNLKVSEPVTVPCK